ncbi:MAG: YdcF family protein [Deltaproteobacteria bacterium]|nr:YdcF family protein [Deltaproteobacteria bacterium]MCW8892528.1 YdcF family protein [Deltaproteobacteria bacterium]MCW9049962.1 YdcF family protein [Deltaproteobacteria bacterium]
MDYYLFLVKKFLGNLLMPVPISLILLIWALLFLLRKKTRWFGVFVVLLATVLLFAASYAPLSSRYITQLEARIPSYQNNNELSDYIAVLGSWHQSVDSLPVTSELSPTAIVRLTEGIRIYRLNPGSKLIFTGFKGIVEDPVSYPEKLRELALALGVPETDILTFDGPRDTGEEAQLIATHFPAAKLVLVTSAPHMPRALGLFRGVGLNPIPAPTEHLGKPCKSWWTFPNAMTLARSEYWAHEGLGYLWARLTGQLKEPTDKN